MSVISVEFDPEPDDSRTPGECIHVAFDEHVMVHDGEEWVVMRGDDWLASFANAEDAEEFADRKRLEP